MRKLKIGDKVRIKCDLSIKQPTKCFLITEAMIKLRGAVATITDITKYSDSNTAYKLDIDDSKYGWEDSMFDEMAIEPKVQIIMFMLGVKQLTIFDNKELQTMISLLEKFRSALVRDCALELSENIFTQFPVTLKFKNGLLVEIPAEDIELGCVTLEDFTKLSFIDSLEVEKELDVFSKASVSLPTFVDFIDNKEIMVCCQHEPQIAIVSDSDKYDEVIGFAVAYTKASLNLSYNEIKKLLEYWK